MHEMTNIWQKEDLSKVLREGKVAVIPTDTIYGIVGSAFSREAVERIYKIRERAIEKPCIILLDGWEDLGKFGIKLTREQENFLQENSPLEKPTSIILECPSEEFTYLHRGTKTLAFRIPENIGLQNLLKEVGPLIAPSANMEGYPPSQNITEAKNYFGEKVDFYLDGGEIQAGASRVVRLNPDGSVEVIRE